MAHMDVVEAKRADWKQDPFEFIERDGYFYGRGTSDDKQGVIATTAARAQAAEAEGFKPKRDIILFFTGDEETERQRRAAGRDRLAQCYRRRICAQRRWRRRRLHSRRHGRSASGCRPPRRSSNPIISPSATAAAIRSRPRPDNAIYELAAALKKLEAHRFTPMLNETTRAYFTERAKQEGDKRARARRCAPGSPIPTTAPPPTRSRPTSSKPASPAPAASRPCWRAAMPQNALPQRAAGDGQLPDHAGGRPEDGRGRAEGDRRCRGRGHAVRRPGPARPRPRRCAPTWSRPTPTRSARCTVRRCRSSRKCRPARPTASGSAPAGIPVYGVDGSWGISPDDERAHGLDERLPVRAIYDNVAALGDDAEGARRDGEPMPASAPEPRQARPERGSGL